RYVRSENRAHEGESLSQTLDIGETLGKRFGPKSLRSLNPGGQAAWSERPVKGTARQTAIAVCGHDADTQFQSYQRRIGVNPVRLDKQPQAFLYLTVADFERAEIERRIDEALAASLVRSLQSRHRRFDIAFAHVAKTLPEGRFGTGCVQLLHSGEKLLHGLIV